VRGISAARHKWKAGKGGRGSVMGERKQRNSDKVVGGGGRHNKGESNFLRGIRADGGGKGELLQLSGSSYSDLQGGGRTESRDGPILFLKREQTKKKQCRTGLCGQPSKGTLIYLRRETRETFCGNKGGKNLEIEKQQLGGGE